MQTTSEIKAAVTNLKYYVEKINELTSKQFDLDMEAYRLGEKMAQGVLSGSVRFNCTGEIGASAARILQHCENIERQVEIIEEQDKKR